MAYGYRITTDDIFAGVNEKIPFRGSRVQQRVLEWCLNPSDANWVRLNACSHMDPLEDRFAGVNDDAFQRSSDSYPNTNGADFGPKHALRESSTSAVNCPVGETSGTLMR